MLRIYDNTGKAVTSKIRNGWRKFTESSGTLIGRMLSRNLKVMLHKACVRSVMCYEAECWAMKTVGIRRI